MKVIRYSHAFKMQLVREVEGGQRCAWQVSQKYDVGNGTVLRWVRQFGRGQYGKVIRVEKPEEISQLARLRSELRRAKEALADTHMELALERAYLVEACEQLHQTVEGFKKKPGGGRCTGRSKPMGR
jgi:transposase-like protein